MEAKIKILQFYRRDLLKCVRSEALVRKSEELEVMRLARQWCVMLSSQRVFACLLQQMKIKILAKRLKLA